MVRNSTKLAAVVAVVLVGAVANEASAHSSQHQRIDRLAYRVMKKSQDLHAEVGAHFRNSPQYRHLAADVTEMTRLARHVHEVAHDGGGLRHLRTDVHKLHRLFHHVGELVDELARTHGTSHRGIRHIRGTLQEMHEALRDLQDELR